MIFGSKEKLGKEPINLLSACPAAIRHWVSNTVAFEDSAGLWWDDAFVTLIMRVLLSRVQNSFQSFVDRTIDTGFA